MLIIIITILRSSITITAIITIIVTIIINIIIINIAIIIINLYLTFKQSKIADIYIYLLTNQN